MSACGPNLLIGGLGGSGTRAVAGVFARLGLYPGGCLNGSNDNLIFTELFKRPDWMREGPSDDEIGRRLDLFAQAMTKGIEPAVLSAWPGLSAYRDPQGEGLAGQPSARGWMTKEPNCHIFLDAALAHWAGTTFVYVTRHPLDMAFSDNKAQMVNWGWMFDLRPEDFATAEAAQLEYWIRTQKRLDGLLSRFGARLHPLSFEKFATDPIAETRAILPLLGLEADQAALETACADVRMPETVGRWRRRDLSIFSEGQLAFCRQAGWDVP